MTTIIDKYFQLFKDNGHLTDQQITDITNMYNNLQPFSTDLLTNYNTILTDKSLTYKNQDESNIFFPKFYTLNKRVFLSDNKDKVLKCITCNNEHKDVFAINFIKEIYCSNSFRNRFNELNINHDIIVPEIQDFGFINYDNTVLIFFILPYYEESSKFNFYYDSINNNVKVNNTVLSKNEFYNLLPDFIEAFNKFISNAVLFKNHIFDNIKLLHNDYNIPDVMSLANDIETINKLLDKKDDNNDSEYSYLMTNVTAISYTINGNVFLHYNNNNEIKFILVDFENTCWLNHMDEDFPGYFDFVNIINCNITDCIPFHNKKKK